MPLEMAFMGVPVVPSLSRACLQTTCPASPALFNLRMSVGTPATTLDPLFKRLGHINKNMRSKASGELSRLPAEETVPRLLELLSETETSYRRAAVQTLGMIGQPAIPPVVEMLKTTDDITVRASCSKVLAAVSMYFPLQRGDFDVGALDAMEAVLDGVANCDPVTKISTVGCLTSLACDRQVVDDEADEDAMRVVAQSEQGGDDIITAPGNTRARSILLRLMEESDDIALVANISGGLAQIANCASPEVKKDITDRLRAVAERPSGADDGEDDGFGYVQEMCRGHVEQLEGTATP